MPKWEVCRIERDAVDKGNFFDDSWSYLWQAAIDTRNGLEVVYESAKCKSGTQSFIDERAKLVAQLLDDGWEPMHTDEQGYVTTFRRQVA